MPSVKGDDGTSSGLLPAIPPSPFQVGTFGVWGDSQKSRGVTGTSARAAGVNGQSIKFSGVNGESELGHGVSGVSVSEGRTESEVITVPADGAGVYGENTQRGGIGVLGWGAHSGVIGQADFIGVSGEGGAIGGWLTGARWGVLANAIDGPAVEAASVNGPGVVARSTRDMGVDGESQTPCPVPRPSCRAPRPSHRAGG